MEPTKHAEDVRCPDISSRYTSSLLPADPTSKCSTLPQPSSKRDLEDGIYDSPKASKLPRLSNLLGGDSSNGLSETPDHPVDDSKEETLVQPEVATDAATVPQSLPKRKPVEWHFSGLPEPIIFRNHLASPEFLEAWREQRKRSVAAGFTEFEDEEDEDDNRIRIRPKHRSSIPKEAEDSVERSSSK